MNNKILTLSPAWVGDTVMAQALFKLLKSHCPDSVIDVLAPPWTAPLLSRMAEVSEVIHAPIQHGQLALKKRYLLAKHLKQKKYQQAIILPNSFKSALIPYWAGIPVRTGWRGEWRYGLVNDMRILDPEKYPLMVERFMALGLPFQQSVVELSARYYPQLTSDARGQELVLTKYGLGNGSRPILSLCPGAEYGPAKQWPARHYAALATEKINAGWEVLILGSPNDQAIANVITHLTNHRCVNLAGKTSLLEAVDLLAYSTAVVCNDSGLMHIAAALDKPLVALYGPTSASFTPPLSSKAKVLSMELACQPCFKRRCPLKHQRCMQELLAQQVNDALQGLI